MILILGHSHFAVALDQAPVCDHSQYVAMVRGLINPRDIVDWDNKSSFRKVGQNMHKMRTGVRRRGHPGDSVLSLASLQKGAMIEIEIEIVAFVHDVLEHVLVRVGLERGRGLGLEIGLARP